MKKRTYIILCIILGIIIGIILSFNGVKLFHCILLPIQLTTMFFLIATIIDLKTNFFKE